MRIRIAILSVTSAAALLACRGNLQIGGEPEGGSDSGMTSPESPGNPAIAPAVPEAGSVVNCSGLPVPQTAIQCPSGVSVTGTYVPESGACVLVYDCPGTGTATDAGGTPVEGSDASSPYTGSCMSGIGPCTSVYDAGSIGSTYSCGQGLSCTCPAEMWPSAPCNAQGQQITYANNYPPAGQTYYSTQAEFNALAVGRWRRTAGQAEINCEVVGIEITDQDTWMPLAVATDGSVQAIPSLEQPIGLVFDGDGGTPSIPGNNIPMFYDICPGQIGMQLLVDPWPANYVRM
jgi:hypothetical protein